VTFEADYVEKRSRLSTFFRWFLAIPHCAVVSVWGVAAFCAIVIAWFALIFTGRWPRGLFDFTAAFARYSTAVNGYLYLLTDAYPPFSGNTGRYPVRLGVGEPKSGYSRMKAALRLLLAVPPMLIAYAMNMVAGVGSFISWFAIVLTGKQPRGLQDMTALGLSYQQRAGAYLALLTEDWPPFTSPQPVLTAAIGPGALTPTVAPEAPVGAGSFAPPAPPPAERRDDDRPAGPGGVTSGDPLG
jgi:hypothetical protein